MVLRKANTTTDTVAVADVDIVKIRIHTTNSQRYDTSRPPCWNSPCRKRCGCRNVFVSIHWLVGRSRCILLLGVSGGRMHVSNLVEKLQVTGDDEITLTLLP
jgi:hypothetical protein